MFLFFFLIAVTALNAVYGGYLRIASSPELLSLLTHALNIDISQVNSVASALGTILPAVTVVADGICAYLFLRRGLRFISGLLTVAAVAAIICSFAV